MHLLVWELCFSIILALFGRDGSSSSINNHQTLVSLALKKNESTSSMILGNTTIRSNGVIPSNLTYSSSIAVQDQSQPSPDEYITDFGFEVQIRKDSSLSDYEIGVNANNITNSVLANHSKSKTEDLGRVEKMKDDFHDVTTIVPFKRPNTNNPLLVLEVKSISPYNYAFDQRNNAHDMRINRTSYEYSDNKDYFQTSNNSHLIESTALGYIRSNNKHTKLEHSTELYELSSQNDTKYSRNVSESTMLTNKQYLKLIVEDKELYETLRKTWIETEHFLNSSDLNAGTEAINLLKEYIDNRRIWLRNIRFLFQNNTGFILPDGTSIENRSEEFDYEEETLTRLQNIVKLSTFLHQMYELDLPGNKTENRDIGTLVKEGNKYLKSFETALNDLERIWHGYNVTGYYMFPLVYPKGDIKNILPVMNETVKNTTNKFAALEAVFRYYVYPSVYFIILVIGVMGNGTLLVMFAKHKEIRTGPNVMVFNLAITDVLNLFVNTPLYYVSKFYSQWIYFDGYGCRMFVITRFTVHTVLAISIVALAVQRYCATVQNLRRASENWGLSMQLRTFLYMFSVWLVAVMCAMPTAIVFEYKDGICFPYAKYQVAVQVLDIFYFVLFVFILPITMIVFSMMTAKRLRVSVRNIPGVMRNSYQKNARHRSAKVVTSLAIAYCVSHIPRSVWFFLVTFLHLNRKANIYFILIDEITNYLMFSNSCLNPMALYFASRSFKKLFRMYLCCSAPNNKRLITPLNRQMTTNSRGRLLSIIEGLSTDINGSKTSLFDKQQNSLRIDSEVCVHAKTNLS
ncbi:hypothetical protein C0J52_05681 [Blattella germanica]|nr:hypothetical protein C0J52_05681 [Blattella germanica]